MPETKKNRYHYDVMNCVAFFGEKQDNGTIDFTNAEALKLPGLRSFEAAANGETSKIRADGIDYIVVTSNNGYDLTLNFVQVDDAFKNGYKGKNIHLLISENYCKVWHL